MGFSYRPTTSRLVALCMGGGRWAHQVQEMAMLHVVVFKKWQFQEIAMSDVTINLSPGLSCCCFFFFFFFFFWGGGGVSEYPRQATGSLLVLGRRVWVPVSSFKFSKI